MSDPDWLTLGVDAVLYTPNRLVAITRLRYVTVTRLTKTRVIFQDGTWINRQTLTRRNGTRGPSTRLLSASDPEVAEAEHKNRASVEALNNLIERATALRDAMNGAS